MTPGRTVPDRPEQGRIAILHDPWPPFLSLLDEDSARASQQFHTFVRTFFTLCPPREHKRLPADLKDDAVHGVYLACIEDDFRRLRSYRNVSRPFAAWFNRLAGNWITDWAARARRTQPGASQEPDASLRRLDAARTLADQRPGQHQILLDQEVLRAVQACIGKLEELCRLLVIGAAEGRTPRELTLLVGWPPDRNKDVSDKLRHCRRVLMHLVRQTGVDVWKHLGRGSN